MSHFLLIHGSWHGAWCWFKVAPRLRHEGHSVAVPDLPGRGRNHKNPRAVSLRAMLRSVAQHLPPTDKTTIVVHSRYGVLASLIAETYPERVDRIIYLAAYMLPSGHTAAQAFRSDRSSLLRPFVEVDRWGLWDMLNPEIYREGLYHDCSDDDVSLAELMLCKEPIRPAVTSSSLSPDRYGKVARCYIRLTEDKAVTVELQDRMLNRVPADRVESIAASHSAYFSMPDKLTETVLKLSAE